MCFAGFAQCSVSNGSQGMDLNRTELWAIRIVNLPRISAYSGSPSLDAAVLTADLVVKATHTLLFAGLGYARDDGALMLGPTRPKWTTNQSKPTWATDGSRPPPALSPAAQERRRRGYGAGIEPALGFCRGSSFTFIGRRQKSPGPKGEEMAVLEKKAAGGLDTDRAEVAERPVASRGAVCGPTYWLVSPRWRSALVR